MNIRLGDIAYLNCHPVRWGLERAGHPFGLISDTPPRLCAELVRGNLDVSPVSLLSYLRHAARLTPLPVAIGSDGPVHSCLLASRVPLGRLDGRPVLLSRESRTTVFVAQVFLEEVVGVRPAYLSAGPDPDAVVLIGDQALRLRHAPPPGWTLHDIGELWRNWTGLPMVFAVWAARRDFAASHPAGLAEVTRALTAAVAAAGASGPAVTAAALPGSGLDEAALAAYFQALDYSFGPRQRAAVRTLSALVARRARLLQEVSLMIKHVVLFKLKPGIGWDDPLVRQAEQMAVQVGERVADLVTWQAARNISPRDVAYDFFVEGRLADQAALDRYLAHPFHQKAIRLWRQISDWVIVDVLEGPNVHAV